MHLCIRIYKVVIMTKIPFLRSFTLFFILLIANISHAQDACYLLGTDGEGAKANLASATLAKVSDGVFEGKATFTESNAFYIATKLAATADDWESIKDDVWCGSRQGARVTLGRAYALYKGYQEGYFFTLRTSGTFNVIVDFNRALFQVSPNFDPDPDPDPNPVYYLNEESKGGCYLFCFLGKNVANKSIYNFTQPSATLQPTETDGVYAGNVQFASSAFTITRALTTLDVRLNDDLFYEVMDSLRPYRYSHPKDLVTFNEKEEMEPDQDWKDYVDFWVRDYDPSHTYYVKVDFNTNQMAVCTSQDEDPFMKQDNEPDDDNPVDVPDIDLTSGAHFTINLTQPGTLKQKLTNAVFATDYDLVDFLTVKGKMGAADIVYLKAQEGLVSQLQYLDLSQVELVYDDGEYYSYTYQKNWGSFGGFIEYHTDIYTLSEENKDEEGNGGFSGATTSEVTYHRRNDLEIAFDGMKYLRQCKLPKGLKGVGNGILVNTPLEKVSLPTAPTYIADAAFKGTNLKSIELPESVDSLGNSCFANTPLQQIDISHVSRFGEYCLANTNLKTAELCNSLKAIPENLFNGCQKLTSVIFPTFVQTIGSGAFSGCRAMTTIDIPSTVQTISSWAFSGCGMTTLTIPNSVTEIGNNAFGGCENLTSVSMGDGVKRIGAGAFAGCVKLKNVTLSANIEEIGNDAFGSEYYGYIPWVKNMPVEDGVKYIGKIAYRFIPERDDYGIPQPRAITIKEGTVSVSDAFAYREDDIEYFNGVITGITLPSTLRILGMDCFRGAAISTIELPESLEKIGALAFAGCSKLRRVTIPQKVKHIGKGAFEDTGLIRVNYNATDATTYNEWDEYLHNNHNISEGYGAIFSPSVTRVIIGEGVKTIPPYLFYGCENLVRVQMASTVETIGERAFCSGNNLEYLDLPSALKSIGDDAFPDVTNFTAYMKEPFLLTSRPSDEEILNDEDNRRELERGNSVDRAYGSNAPFGDVLYYYHIEPDRTLTWGEVTVSPYSQKKSVLKVPNGSLSAYQGENTWALFFQEITTFDGASAAETIEETTTVSVKQSVTEETDLSSTMMGNVFVTLDTEDSGDGYNAEQGCLIINSTVTDEGLAAATADNSDDLTVKNYFNGLILEVPAGKGNIVIDCKTLGSRAIYVKIGTNEPQMISAANRNTVSVDYDVLLNSRIYIYAANIQQANVAEYQVRRATAYANDDAVEIYGLSINIIEDNQDAIKDIQSTTGKVQKVYENGHINILTPNGKKYSVDGRLEIRD